MNNRYDFHRPSQVFTIGGGLSSDWVWTAVVDAKYSRGEVHLWMNKPGGRAWNPAIFFCPKDEEYTHGNLQGSSLYGRDVGALAHKVMLSIKADISENWWLFVNQILR